MSYRLSNTRRKRYIGGRTRSVEDTMGLKVRAGLVGEVIKMGVYGKKDSGNEHSITRWAKYKAVSGINKMRINKLRKQINKLSASDIPTIELVQFCND